LATESLQTHFFFEFFKFNFAFWRNWASYKKALTQRPTSSICLTAAASCTHTHGLTPPAPKLCVFLNWCIHMAQIQKHRTCHDSPIELRAVTRVTSSAARALSLWWGRERTKYNTVGCCSVHVMLNSLLCFATRSPAPPPGLQAPAFLPTFIRVVFLLMGVSEEAVILFKEFLFVAKVAFIHREMSKKSGDCSEEFSQIWL